MNRVSGILGQRCHNLERHVQTLKKLKEGIRRVRPNRKVNQVFLLHDNASPHIGLRIREAISTRGWTVLPHRPYSPNTLHSEETISRTRPNTACLKNSDASAKCSTRPAYSVPSKSGKSVLIPTETL